MIFRKAEKSDLSQIERIIKDAVKFMGESGLDQWQNGYPAREDMERDIENGISYVLCDGDLVCGVCAVTAEPEDAYNEIDGKWLNDEEYAVVHRSAVLGKVRGKGYGRALFAEIERHCAESGIKNIRIDTHRDNKPMQALLRAAGYEKCGVVTYPEEEGGIVRDAFQKII